MKTTCYLVLLALIATAIAIKPHDHSFGEKVKEKGESMMEGVKASTNDAADTLNQAKYKVKHAMNGAKDTKEWMKEGIKEGYETVKEGLENAKEVLNVNQVVEDTKEAAKAKLADVTPITQNMTTIAIEAKNAIKKGLTGQYPEDMKDKMGKPVFVEELKMSHQHLTESEEDKFHKKNK